VDSIADHGGRVYTVDLLPASPVPHFRPGQFLHLTVDEYDPAGFWPESRVFSIASSPLDRKLLRICYAVKGRYTARMEQILKAGGEVWVKLPYGDFVIREQEDAVLIAGGTGISAFTAFIEALPAGRERPLWLVYGARNGGLFLFHEAILKQVARVPAFKAIFFIESPDPERDITLGLSAANVEAIPGRIQLEAVWNRIPEVRRKVFYLSGPPVMLKELSAGLKERMVVPDNIRIDAWE
jgi:ferredoxin-NADP reductase